VRKKVGEQVSVALNYYVDMVTSASIDVKTSGASEYKEERKQSSLSVDYLRGKTTYNLSYIDSKESDYAAQTVSFGISEDMFGDLTTISLGFTRAWDDVAKNVKVGGKLVRDDVFGERESDHRMYRIGVSQVLTKHLIVGLNFEAQTHEGELANPYRSIRQLNIAGTAVEAAPERYPNTRTTNAFSINGRYFLPYRAAIQGSYRFFTDTWGITASTYELGYIHPWRNWTIEGTYRHHSQEKADFYSDLFPRPDFQNFMARDRNLATMTNQTFRLGVTYDITQLESWTQSRLKKGSVNLFFDRISFEFDDFRDGTKSLSRYTPTDQLKNPGTEPMYTEDANVIRFFVSVWF
jgi:hypothetical protein